MIKSINYISDQAKKEAELQALGELMNIFTDEMLKKLIYNVEKGKSGWDSPEIIESLKNQLSNNINNQDWVDVANISMMLWNLKQK